MSASFCSSRHAAACCKLDSRFILGTSDQLISSVASERRLLYCPYATEVVRDRDPVAPTRDTISGCGLESSGAASFHPSARPCTSRPGKAPPQHHVSSTPGTLPHELQLHHPQCAPPCLSARSSSPPSAAQQLPPALGPSHPAKPPSPAKATPKAPPSGTNPTPFQASPTSNPPLASMPPTQYPHPFPSAARRSSNSPSSSNPAPPPAAHTRPSSSSPTRRPTSKHSTRSP